MAGRGEGKVAIVTGGASGIGRGIVKLLVAEGAKVVFADIAEENGRHVAAELGEKNCVFVRADVANESGVRSYIDAAVARFGGVHWFVHAAAGYAAGAIEDVTLDDYHACIDRIMTAAFLATKHLIPVFKSQGGGAIVNISSLAGLFGYPQTPVYSAAKHGIIGWTKGAATQLAEHNIRINVVAPGWTMTPAHYPAFDHVSVEERPEAMRRQFAKKQPLRRAGEPEDIAQAVLYLLSDAARFVTGQTITVDGGLSAVSRAFDEPPT
jgi:NAD(P)-dependent dehydrogenase (short-subunit alcohol dehydrogenase family)